MNNNIKGLEDLLPEDLLSVRDTSVSDYQYFKGLENRELLILDGIDEDAIERYVMPIIKWNKEDEGKDINSRKPIKIYISCVGGIVPLGLSIIDIIKSSKTPIIGINLAFAYSMGFLIFLACPVKKCFKFSSFLLHDGSLLIQNSTSKVKNYLEYQNEQEEMMKDFILSHTKITEAEYEKNYSKEWFMSASKALELGVTDEIIDYIL